MVIMDDVCATEMLVKENFRLMEEIKHLKKELKDKERIIKKLTKGKMIYNEDEDRIEYR